MMPLTKLGKQLRNLNATLDVIGQEKGQIDL
jgi:hypothetical protein